MQLILLLLLLLLLLSFSVLFIASYTLLEPGPILGPDEVPGDYFILMDRSLSQYVRCSWEGDLLQLSYVTGSTDLS